MTITSHTYLYLGATDVCLFAVKILAVNDSDFLVSPTHTHGGSGVGSFVVGSYHSVTAMGGPLSLAQQLSGASSDTAAAAATGAGAASASGSAASASASDRYGSGAGSKMVGAATAIAAPKKPGAINLNAPPVGSAAGVSTPFSPTAPSDLSSATASANATAPIAAAAAAGASSIGPAPRLRLLRRFKTTTLAAATDIKWNPHLHESHASWLVTAATNGKLLLWNVHRAGLTGAAASAGGPNSNANVLGGATSDCVAFEEHDRTVNRVCWHPTEPSWLLSASQDGNVKLWDVRQTKRPQSMTTFDEKSSSVRDVQVAPLASNYFAAAYENGSIQIWDIRRGRVRTLNAHQGLVMCLDWHPTERDILASGGRDRTIKIWDIGFGSLSASAAAASTLR